MGFTDRDYRVAKMTIQYEVLAPVLLNIHNEEDPESDEPSVICKTKVLERCLTRFEDQENMSILVLLHFLVTYEKTRKSVKDYARHLKENGNDMPGGFKIEENGLKVKAEDLGEALNMIKKLLEMKPIASAMEFLKDSNADYDKFIAFTVDEVEYHDALDGHKTPVPKENKEDEESGDYGDIDDIIRKAFENKGQDEE